MYLETCKSMVLRYEKHAVKEIRALPPQVRKRLRIKLEFWIAQSDPLTFAKRLTRPADAEYRYRIGDYRVLFDVREEEILILKIQHRRDVYR